jgi:hypothetical protein
LAIINNTKLAATKTAAPRIKEIARPRCLKKLSVLTAGNAGGAVSGSDEGSGVVASGKISGTAGGSRI